MYEKEISEELFRRLKIKFPNNYLTKERTFKTCRTAFGNREYGKIDSRIDLFMINDLKFIGYEIKSAKDNPKRLVKQIEKYRKYVNKLIIVTEPKHAKRVESIVPDFCGIMEVFKNGNKWDVFTTKKAKIIWEQKPRDLITVLWKKELYNFLKKKKEHISGVSKTQLCSIALEIYSLDEIKTMIRDAFIARVQKGNQMESKKIILNRDLEKN